MASIRPRRIRITPKSGNRKWPQVKLRSELTISEQCSENISHKHALSYKNKDRHYEWAYGPGDKIIVFAVVPLDAQLRMRNESCERAALAFALLHCTASTICTTHSLGRLSFNSTSGSS